MGNRVNLNSIFTRYLILFYCGRFNDEMGKFLHDYGGNLEKFLSFKDFN